MTLKLFALLTSIPVILAVSIIVMAGLFLIKLQSLPPQIPLFYSRLEGDDQIADAMMIFLLPLLSIGIVTINMIMVKKYCKNNDFVATVTYYVNLSAIVIITFIFARIIFLVT